MLNRVGLNKLGHVELILVEALFLKSPGFRLAGWQPTVIAPRPQLRKGGTGDKHKPAEYLGPNFGIDWLLSI